MTERHDQHDNPFAHPSEDVQPAPRRAVGAVVVATTAAVANIVLGFLLMNEATTGTWFLLIAMGFVPIAGGAILLVRRLAPRACSCRVGDMAYSLALAGWLLASSLELKLLEKWEFIGDPLADDLRIALLGAFLVISGNRMPKILTPLSATRCDPVRAQRVQRFAGWTFVLAGLALIDIALLVPEGAQDTLIIGTMVTAMIAVLVRKLTLPARSTDTSSNAATMTATHPGS